MQGGPIDPEQIDETAPLEVLSSLSRSINWLIRAIHKGTYRNIDSLSSIVPCLYSIIDNGFQQFIYSEEDHPEELSMRLDTDYQKCVWINRELQYFEKSFDYLHDFLSIIADESENGQWDPYYLQDYDDKGVFSFCINPCGIRYYCLYIFKELMPIFIPSYIFCEQESIIRKEFERNSSNIATILEKNFTSSKEYTGWIYEAGAVNECEVDAYVTASLLVTLANWKGYEKMLIKATDFWDSNTIQSCIKSVEALQKAPDGKKNTGQWIEFYSNKKIYRVRTAAKIAISLITLGQMGVKINDDIIKSVEEYIKNSLTKEGTCLDTSCFSDVIKARESDIPGTIASIELRLTRGIESPRELDIVDSVNWLLNQQRYDGSWPIQSKSLLDSSYKTGKANVKIRPEEHDEKNISLANTIDTIRTLSLYYKSYLNDLDKRLTRKP